jgi:integration host factor subunit beta
MTRSELVNALIERQPQLLKRDVELAVSCMLEQMANALENGDRIEIRGFGAFAMSQRPPRLARNPKTGESVDSPAKVVIHFKSGKEMRDRVNDARDKCDIAD